MSIIKLVSGHKKTCHEAMS